MNPARLAALLVTGGLCTATPALAEAAPPAEAAGAREPASAAAPAEPPSAVAQAPAAAVPAASATPASGGAAPAAATAPAAPAPAENLIRVYGLVNPRFIASSGASESYSQPNATAITAAGNPVISAAHQASRYTFQAGQSRIGFWANEKGALRAQLEFDFVDFTKPTPTVQALPRVRIARADYAFAPGHVLSMGQDWDLHAPLNPHGINLVGGLFQAGNSGFMRQQLKYAYAAKEFEVGAAVGFPSNNAGAAFNGVQTGRDGALELGSLPTLALRGIYKFEQGRVGVSAIGTQLAYGPLGTPQQRNSLSYQAVLFSELNPTSTTNVRLELNVGQNTANLFLLTLAQGTLASDAQDAGGFLSVRQVVVPNHAVYALLGRQQVLNAEGSRPSYALVSVGTDGTRNLALSAANGPGMRYNNAARLGYEFKPTAAMSLVFEGFVYQSHHRLMAEERANTSGVTRSVGVETGMLFSF